MPFQEALGATKLEGPAMRSLQRGGFCRATSPPRHSRCLANGALHTASFSWAPLPVSSEPLLSLAARSPWQAHALCVSSYVTLLFPFLWPWDCVVIAPFSLQLPPGIVVTPGAGTSWLLFEGFLQCTMVVNVPLA